MIRAGALVLTRFSSKPLEVDGSMADRTQNRQQLPQQPTGDRESLAEPSAFRPGEEAGGLSLDQLGAAFAQMLDQGHDPYTGKADASDSLVYRSAAEADLEAALDPQQAAGVGSRLAVSSRPCCSLAAPRTSR